LLEVALTIHYHGWPKGTPKR